ncbi:MAG: beta-ketoacyl-ACP synthase II [Acidobacteriia bacterium]|nr:beta-ketoacyl-ACP synthase II [Terriglobia bacterium]
MRRVVVTGLGVISAVGHTVEDFFHSLVAGESGVGYITQIDNTPLTVKIAAEVKHYDPNHYFLPKRQDYLDRFAQFAIIAATQALEDSGFSPSEGEKLRFGACVGTGMGGAETLDNGFRQLYKNNAQRMHPFTIPKLMHNAAASHISMEFGCKGPSLSFTTACSSAANAIGEGFRLIKYGQADTILAGGAEAPIAYGILRAWEAMRVMALGNGDPKRACRPFSRDREGLVLGEGAGILLLEEFEHARARGARIYAEISGYGMTSDADHLTHPTSEGPSRAMQLALEEARLNPEEIDYINAHGTATPTNDVNETRAIKAVFGSKPNLVVTSTKSMHGHAMGATGALEMIVTVLAIHRGLIPPTANYTVPDPECDLDYSPNRARERTVNAALSNSFAFGGLNAALLAKKVEFAADRVS